MSICIPLLSNTSSTGRFDVISSHVSLPVLDLYPVPRRVSLDVVQLVRVILEKFDERLLSCLSLAEHGDRAFFGAGQIWRLVRFIVFIFAEIQSAYVLRTIIASAAQSD